MKRCLFLFGFILLAFFEPEKSALAASPSRVISLTPAITEIIFELHSENKLVGVSTYSDHPDAAKRIPRVGDYAHPNMELIISLRPDLVIGSNEGLDTYSSTLRKLKINFLLIDLKRLDDYPTAVQKIADHLGMSASAKTVINDWNSSWSSIPKTRAPKDVLIQVDHNPLVISGGDTFLSDVITRCGHINVAQSKTGYPTIQIEGLAKFKPKLVLATVHSTESQKLEVSTFWKNQKIIPTPNFVQVDANDASRLGPRLAATAKSICKLMDETK